MIMLAGAPASVDTSAWSPRARDIYERKRRSPFVFEYDTLAQLRFEMMLRAAIVEAAIALDHSGVEFETFEHARCNEQFWLLTPLGGFQQRPGVSAADAIRDIYRNGALYAFECATAIPIVYYKAVLDVLGDATFNRLFQDILLYSWNYDSDLGLIQEFADPGRAVPGDVLYFSNPDHHPRMPEWQGVNVVMIDDDLYYGHGVGITSGMDIIAGLNARRRPLSFRSAFLMDLIVYPDFRYLSQFAPGSSTGGGGAVPPSSAVQGIAYASGPTGTGSPSVYTPASASGMIWQPWASGAQGSSYRPEPWRSLPPASPADARERIRSRVGRRRCVM